MTTWLITGSSRGLGRAIAIAALERGDQVVATARRPAALADLIDTYGERVLTVALDVTDPHSVEESLRAGVERFGRLDVVVNNAGYADLSAVETDSEENFRRQFETNFFGVYHVSRAAVPLLRSAGGGLLVQVSSVGGRVGGSPGIASYQAAKFAVDGFTRALAAEVAPFGIGTLVVEPSGFATDWAGASMTVHDLPAEYDSTIGGMQRQVRGATQGAAGDPDRAAQIIVDVVGRRDIPSHLLLGTNAVNLALAYSSAQHDEASTWADVSRSADFANPFPVPFPADATG